jgi:hypothetical protein
MAKSNTQSKLLSYPYSRKDAPDYKSLPISKARRRKIEHVRRLIAKSEWSPARVRHYAIHGMNMVGSDVVEAFKGDK